jgi:hypothetical protein
MTQVSSQDRLNYEQYVTQCHIVTQAGSGDPVTIGRMFVVGIVRQEALTKIKYSGKVFWPNFEQPQKLTLAASDLSSWV